MRTARRMETRDLFGESSILFTSCEGRIRIAHRRFQYVQSYIRPLKSRKQNGFLVL